jgi:hypothetical protein
MRGISKMYTLKGGEVGPGGWRELRLDKWKEEGERKEQRNEGGSYSRGN